MRENEPQNLWLYGEVEPWRRGRTILVSIGLFFAFAHALVLWAFFRSGLIEVALGTTIVLILWWLGFAFIWFGTHWVRWLLGAYTLLAGFVYFIWGIRDASVIQLTVGVLDLLIGAFFFAPSVHHFALRQKESIRWPEKLIVSGAFLLLAMSLLLALVALGFDRADVEREAQRYGMESLQKIFVENDTYYLLAEASEEWLHQPAGNLAVTQPLTDKVMRLGNVEYVRVTKTELHPIYRFPLTVGYVGLIDGEGQGRCGAVWLRLAVTRSAQGWRINGFWWRCWDPNRF
jgi:hypothetical protein